MRVADLLGVYEQNPDVYKMLIAAHVIDVSLTKAYYENVRLKPAKI
jgi:hypothetical protein